MMARGSRLLAVAAAASIGLGACNDTPTTAVVTNGFAATTAVSVYKLWWLETLFPDAVAPGAASAVQRTIPGSDYAYALLAPGWSAADGPPRTLVPIKSAAKLTAYDHQLLRIIVAEATFTGDCVSSVLTADDATLIRTQLFPGEFAGATYDPATCTTTLTAGAGGAGGESGAGGSAGAPGDQGNGGGPGGGDQGGAAGSGP